MHLTVLLNRVELPVEFGYLDDVEEDKIPEFIKSFHAFMHAKQKKLMSDIEKNPVFDDNLKAKLVEIVEAYKG